MTLSAPKSVSVMAIVGGDERLVTAHETAVREALEEAEKHSATRVRLASLNENRTTGNWIVAAYTHDTSRELDPQLHTHAVAANLTSRNSLSLHHRYMKNDTRLLTQTMQKRVDKMMPCHAAAGTGG